MENQKKKPVIIPLCEEETEKLHVDLASGKARVESVGKFKLTFEKDADGNTVRKWVKIEE